MAQVFNIVSNLKVWPLSCTVNAIATEDWATKGTNESKATILNWLSQNIPISAPVGFSSFALHVVNSYLVKYTHSPSCIDFIYYIVMMCIPSFPFFYLYFVYFSYYSKLQNALTTLECRCGYHHTRHAWTTSESVTLYPTKYAHVLVTIYFAVPIS